MNADTLRKRTERALRYVTYAQIEKRSGVSVKAWRNMVNGQEPREFTRKVMADTLEQLGF